MYLTQKEIYYSFFQLAQRAGIREASAAISPLEYYPLDLQYGSSLDNFGAKKAGFLITFHQVPRSSLDELVISPSVMMQWVDTKKLLPPGVSLPISEKLPIFFIKEDHQQLVKYEKSAVTFNFDLPAVIFFFLSRYEELKSPKRDKYGRFPAASSVACRFGFAEQPLVDELALIFRVWLQYLLPEWKPEKRKGEVLLTHDIDFVRTLPNMRKILRAFCNQARSNGPHKAIQNVLSTLKDEKADLSSSVYMRSIYNICDHSKRNGLNSLFFFKASLPSFYDSGYQVDHVALKGLFKDLTAEGFEFGLHPGFYAFRNVEKMKKEKSRLENASGQSIVRCRQHYLRFDAGKTWQAQQSTGFTHDYSMGFAEQVGFRCGTCHPFHPFDFVDQHEMDIIEIPLIVMDSSLKDYMRLPVEEARKKVLSLAEKCLNVEGVFSLLWHNTSFFNDWQPWGEMYLSVLPELSALV